MNWYLDIVKAYPIYSAMVQFAILGSLGDFIAKWIQGRKAGQSFPYQGKLLALYIAWKPLEWVILAVLIKAAFIGFTGFVDALVDKALIPKCFSTSGCPLNAAAISISMNAQFGLLLVIVHRALDCLPFGKIQWDGIVKGFYSLVWFWIPAHTITFMLPKDFQIGLAAVWSLALGLILGLFNTSGIQKKVVTEEKI